MRSQRFGRKLRETFTGIAATGDGVLAYWPRTLEGDDPDLPAYGVRRLSFTGRRAVASHVGLRLDRLVTPLTVLGGAYTLGGPQELDGGGTVTHGTVGKWGMRYPNVTSVGRSPDGAVLFLWRAGETGRTSMPFYPWRVAPTAIGLTPRGALTWQLAPDRYDYQKLCRMSDVEVVAPNFGVAVMRGLYPGSLLAVTPEGTGFYHLRRETQAEFWDVTRPPGQRMCRAMTLNPPADLRHPAPSDFQVAADGRRLFVAWSGKGVDNRRRACALGVYDAETGATQTIYSFPAALLAPSPDGQTLAFLSDFGGGEETTLYQIDLD